MYTGNTIICPVCERLGRKSNGRSYVHCPAYKGQLVHVSHCTVDGCRYHKAVCSIDWCGFKRRKEVKECASEAHD